MLLPAPVFSWRWLRWKRWTAVGAGWVALNLGTQFMHCFIFWMVSFTHFHSLGIICCHCSGRKLTLWAGLHRCMNEHMDSWGVLGWYGQIVLFSFLDKFWIGVLNLVETFPVENTVGLVCQEILCFMRLGGFFFLQILGLGLFALWTVLHNGI